MNDPSGRLLLDTHVWIWLMEGVVGEIAPSALDAIRRGSARGELLVSTISVWEVATLEAKGRVRLAMELDEWVRRGLTAPGVRLAELTPEIVVESTRLPGTVHGDPADRMLVATARRTGATLMTRDEKILAYGESGYLGTLSA